LSCDCVTADRRLWIEYAGMKGIHYRDVGRIYSNRLRRKKRIARQHALRLVVMTRRDLGKKFPVCRKLIRGLLAVIQSEV
jgi:hypothetical protein